MGRRTQRDKGGGLYRPIFVLGAGLVAGSACAAGAGPGAAVTVSDDRVILGIVRYALAEDAAGRSPDSLYVSDGTVVANGSERRAAPRFAGIGRDGRVSITLLTGEVVTPFAWASAVYRWTSPDGSAETARATFVFSNADGRWRIKHAHSSVALPWENDEGAAERDVVSHSLLIHP